MTITNTIKNICANLGKNNKSTYSVVAIAAANGIFRPTFTMLKKGEDPQSKKYAALREGLTELIAIPSYLICGELAAKCGEKIAAKAADKEIAELAKQGKPLTEKAKQIFKDSKIKDSKASLMLIGVCIAAGLVIPALCSAVVKPVMKKLNKKSDNTQVEKPQVLDQNNSQKLDIKENVVNETTPIQTIQPQQINRPIFSNMMPSGMKVGGL